MSRSVVRWRAVPFAHARNVLVALRNVDDTLASLWIWRGAGHARTASPKAIAPANRDDHEEKYLSGQEENYVFGIHTHGGNGQHCAATSACGRRRKRSKSLCRTDPYAAVCRRRYARIP